MKKELTLFYRANTDKGICIALGEDPADLYNMTLRSHKDFLNDIPNVGSIDWYFEQTDYHIQKIWRTVSPEYDGKQPPFGKNISLDTRDERIRESLVIVIMNIINLTLCGALEQDEYNGTLFRTMV